MTATWSAAVRYAEIDGQHIVFNAHYLTYCDEAMTAFLRARAVGVSSADIRVVASQLVWSGSARFGDVVEVDASCRTIGRTSFVIDFDIRAAGASVCRVSTTYVHTDRDGRPQPVPDDTRVALLDAG